MPPGAVLGWAIRDGPPLVATREFLGEEAGHGPGQVLAETRVAQAGTPVALSLPCPACGADMKKRLAKRGVNAGQYFWSCVRHPECKGTRRVRAE